MGNSDNKKYKKLQKPKRVATMTPPLLQPALRFFFFFAVATVSGQSLPPARADGFLYPNHGIDSDTIMIEAFLDPVCPDSRDSWAPLKQALQHYGHRVALVVHLLPLPYHDNAFVTSRALHVVNKLNSSATFHMLEWFFKHQAKFYNAQTRDMTRAEVLDLIVKSATEVVGNSFYSALESGFNDRQTDLKTRVSFKYSASRGVFGTPVFYINGFSLPDPGSPLTLSGWKSYIDPLIRAQGVKDDETSHFFL